MGAPNGIMPNGGMNGAPNGGIPPPNGGGGMPGNGPGKPAGGGPPGPNIPFRKKIDFLVLAFLQLNKEKGK